MAPSQPIHKCALVLGLKEIEKNVATIGDVTNDDPALSKSDVWFAIFAELILQKKQVILLL